MDTAARLKHTPAQSRFTLERIGVQIKTPGGGSRWALRDISLSFQANERIGLLGRNGSGKTTLARLIGRVDRPTTGKLTIHPEHTRALLVLQRPEDHFVRGRVGQQINSYARNPLSPEAIHGLLDQVGLPVEAGRWPPLKLSTGQQRLVAIACALASQSPLVIMDEPMAGLDAAGRQLVRQSLLQIGATRNLGWIIVSHHPDDLLGLVDRIWILESGSLLYDGLFQRAPLDALNACLTTGSNSLYYCLRHLESHGVTLPETVYSITDLDEIAGHLIGGHLP